MLYANPSYNINDHAIYVPRLIAIKLLLGGGPKKLIRSPFRRSIHSYNIGKYSANVVSTEQPVLLNMKAHKSKYMSISKYSYYKPDKIWEI